MQEKVFILIQESKIGGEIAVNATPCRTREKAKQVMNEELAILMASGHYTECEKENLLIEETASTYFIKDVTPFETEDYYEYFKIEEREIV